MIVTDRLLAGLTDVTVWLCNSATQWQKSEEQPPHWSWSAKLSCGGGAGWLPVGGGAERHPPAFDLVQFGVGQLDQ